MTHYITKCFHLDVLTEKKNQQYFDEKIYFEIKEYIDFIDNDLCKQPIFQGNILVENVLYMEMNKVITTSEKKELILITFLLAYIADRFG